MPSSRKRKEANRSAKVADRDDTQRRKAAKKKLEDADAAQTASDAASRAARALEFKQRGNERFGAGEHAEAADLYELGIGIDPNNHVLHSNLAACHLEMEDLEAAAAAAKRCVELAPEFAKGYFRLATALHGLEEHARAARVAREGLLHAGEQPSLRELLQECKGQQNTKLSDL